MCLSEKIIYNILKSLKGMKLLSAGYFSLYRLLRALTLLLCLIFVFIFIVGCSSEKENSSASNHNTSVYFQVRPGMTGDNIIKLLTEKNIIKSPLKFRMLAKLKGAEGKFQTGTYEFTTDMDSYAVIDMLTSGKTSTIRFTIPEGYTINEIADRLDKMGIVKASEFKKAAADYAPYPYMLFVPGQKYRAEGFLFPDTYEAPSDASAKQILQLMTENFNNRLTLELRDLAAAKGLSIYELVTFASLVEKEAGADDERPVIAQVFHKRLEIFQPLESDASVQYLLDAPKEDMMISDTKIESPYNTYRNYGLPLGPIANPGLNSLEAVLKPANTDYLYFVADRQGKSHFSRTYEDHLVEVNKYR